MKLTGNRVRQIIHDNADRLWSTHMQQDVDKSKLLNLTERTMDRTEWGAFEQIILWSKIYQIKIEVYFYNMNMQTIYGDEFILG
eukprot:15559804-Heterocapsa_arctica.AAC.1